MSTGHFSNSVMDAAALFALTNTPLSAVGINQHPFAEVPNTLAEQTPPGEGGNTSINSVVAVFPQNIMAAFDHIGDGASQYNGCGLDGYDDAYTAGILAGILTHELLHACLGNGITQSMNGQNNYYSCLHLAIETEVARIICASISTLLHEACEESIPLEKVLALEFLIGLCDYHKSIHEKWDDPGDPDGPALTGRLAAQYCYDNDPNVEPWGGSGIPGCGLSILTGPAGSNGSPIAECPDCPIPASPCPQ